MSDKITLPTPKNRKIFFSKQVDQETIEEVSKQIIEINENDEYLVKLYEIHDLEYKPKPIEIFIDSYGGYVYQIFGLVGIMEKSKTPIHTICTGAAMSCGFILLINGHKRFCYEYGTPLYHQVSSVAWGEVQNMEEELKEVKRLQNKMEEMTLRKTKITKERLDEIREKKIDWFMTADEALKLGVVDEIV